MRTACFYRAIPASAAFLLALAGGGCGEKKQPVQIQVTPGNAMVFLDGNYIGQAKAGLLVIDDLAAGDHVLKATLDGYQDRIVPLKGSPGLVFPVKLEPKKGGTIVVTSTPEGGEVFRDGAREKSLTPCRIENVPPGAVHIRVDRAGFKPFEKQLEVRSGEEVTVEAALVSKAEELLSVEIAKDPTNVEKHVDLLREFASQKRYAEALKVGDLLVALAGEKPGDLHFNRAVEELEKAARAVAEPIRALKDEAAKAAVVDLVRQILRRRLDIKILQEEVRIQELEKQVVSLKERVTDLRENRTARIETRIEELLKKKIPR